MFIGQFALAQSYIKGVVSDSSGVQLGGVSIFTDDQLYAVVSEEDGTYILKVPPEKGYTIYFFYQKTRVIRTIKPLKNKETIT
ncbi:MAG: hypothetical protein ACKVQB_01655, partial [Bacteroidia bacterium]